MSSSGSSHPFSSAYLHTISNCCSIVSSLTCREVETRTYAATLMVLLLAVRARSASLLVLQAPLHDGLVSLVPALPRVRAFHCFPMYAPAPFHHLLRAE